MGVGIVVSRCLNGNIEAKTTYIKGVRDGSFEAYFQSGILEKKFLQKRFMERSVSILSGKWDPEVRDNLC